MHWIRIDRYFSAAKYEQAEIPEDVQVSFMELLVHIVRMRRAKAYVR